MALEKFRAPDVRGEGRAQLSPDGWTQHAGVMGDLESYNAETAVAAGNGLLTFGKPVRSIVVRSTVDCYVAASAAALAGAGNGQALGLRFFVPANVYRELPWYQNEVHHKATAGAGTLYVEGRR